MKRKEKKRHKKPKINFWLKLLIVLAAAAGIYLFASSSMFDVTAYEVEGNSYYTDEEILVTARPAAIFSGGPTAETSKSAWNRTPTWKM